MLPYIYCINIESKTPCKLANVTLFCVDFENKFIILWLTKPNKPTHIMKSHFLAATLTALSFSVVAKERPNILWIITDDHRADALECYNRATRGTNESSLGYVSSPNIDKLAKEGTLFVNTFCNSPMSCVSRASMHTGQYAFRSGRYKFFSHQEAECSHPIISQILREEGYGTAAFGKTHYGIASKLNGKERKETDLIDFTVEFNRDLQRYGFADIIGAAGSKFEFVDGILDMIKTYEKVHYPDGTTQTYMTSSRDGEIPAEDLKIKREVEEKYEILRAYTRINDVLIMGGESTKKAGETVDGYIVKEMSNYLKKQQQRV